jgi:hypothetical protein
MAGQGPAHIFVYYQKPYKLNEQGEVEELRQPAEFQVTDGKSKAHFLQLSGTFVLAATFDSKFKYFGAIL